MYVFLNYTDYSSSVVTSQDKETHRFVFPPSYKTVKTTNIIRRIILTFA